MIKATIFERYVPESGQIIKETLLDTRYFSSIEKFQEWYSTFKEELWENDKDKVELVEGIYVKTEEISLDDTSKPKKLKLHTKFRKGISYHYAA